MSDYPRVRTLLTELLRLGAEDAQLPLAVLVNLHRRVLIAPFERFGAEVLPAASEHGFRIATDHMTQFWPAVHEELFRGHGILDALSIRGPDDVPETIANGWSKELRDLCQNGLWQWQAYEPLISLCALGWPGTNLIVMFEMLEIELGMEPSIRELLLHYGRDEVDRGWF